MIEGVVIFVLLVGTAITIWVKTVHNAKSPWVAAGSYVQDVSRASGVQTEVAVAVDPSNTRNVFAAANESLEPEIRVLTSTNGGRRWSTQSGPLFDPNTCAWGDPAVAVGPDGRQYVAFTEKAICAPGPDLTPYLVVASRSGPKGKLAGAAHHAPGDEVRLRRQARDRGGRGRPGLRCVVSPAQVAIPVDRRELERGRRQDLVRAGPGGPVVAATSARHDRNRRQGRGVHRRSRRPAGHLDRAFA